MTYRAASLFLLLAAVTVAERPAHACGGCINATPVAGGSQSPSVVTDHRIVLSLSAKSTTLWDQLEYAGDPDGFAWVLPVSGEFTLGVGSDRFVDTLDQLTAPTIQGPTVVCRRGRGTSGTVTDEESANAGMGSGGGCGGSSSSAPATRTTVRTSDGDKATEDFTIGQSENDVVVTDRSTVGPYEAVTIRPSAGANIVDWLRRNGYEVPFTIEPILKAYTAENFDFVAVRLRPGFGVHAMRPIRVTWSGTQVTFPLRLVAAGVADRVGIQLFVIGDGRWKTKSYPSFEVSRADLVWDFNIGRSNYTKLRAEGAEALGAAFALESSISVTGDDFPEPEPLQPEPEPEPVDAGAIDGSIDDASVDGEVLETSTDASSTDASSTDAAITDVASEVAAPEPPQPTDVELAFPSRTSRRLTRLRADLPLRALTTDLTVEADVDQAYLSTRIDVVKYQNFQVVCPDAATPAPASTQNTNTVNASGSSESSCECSTGPSHSLVAPPLAFLVAAACASAVRRVARRRRR